MSPPKRSLLGRPHRRSPLGWLLAICVSFLAGDAATARAQHPFGLSREALVRGGALVIAGGGALPDEVYDEFVRLAGGESARLVIIPTAHPFESLADAKRAYGGWYDMEARSVDFLHCDDPDEADDEQVVAPLRRATGVWIGGGAQGRLADRYVDTRVHRELQRVVERGGVVGGTSAGASILSRTMIRYGSNTRASTDRGLGLLTSAVIDQHFIRRGRQPRLLAVLAEEPEQWGIGVDERTALVVHRTKIRVLGESQVVLCRGATERREAWIKTLSAGREHELASVLERERE